MRIRIRISYTHCSCKKSRKKLARRNGHCSLWEHCRNTLTLDAAAGAHEITNIKQRCHTNRSIHADLPRLPRRCGRSSYSCKTCFNEILTEFKRKYIRTRRCCCSGTAGALTAGVSRAAVRYRIRTICWCWRLRRLRGCGCGCLLRVLSAKIRCVSVAHRLLGTLFAVCI